MNKISGQACNIIKKRLQSRYLPANFAKFSRTPPDDSFEKFTLHVWFICRQYVLYMETLNFKIIKLMNTRILRSSHPEVFLIKDILKICSKFTLEHPCRSVTSIKLQSNFIKITLRLKCSPVNLLHIFRNLSQETPLDGCFSIFLQNHWKQQTSIVICNLNQLPPDFQTKS